MMYNTLLYTGPSTQNAHTQQTKLYKHLQSRAAYTHKRSHAHSSGPTGCYVNARVRARAVRVRVFYACDVICSANRHKCAWKRVSEKGQRERDTVACTRAFCVCVAPVPVVPAYTLACSQKWRRVPSNVFVFWMKQNIEISEYACDDLVHLLQTDCGWRVCSCVSECVCVCVFSV